MVARSTVRSWSSYYLPPLVRQTMPFSRTFSQLCHKHYLFPINLLFTLIFKSAIYDTFQKLSFLCGQMRFAVASEFGSRRWCSQSDGDTGKGRLNVSGLHSGKIIGMCDSRLAGYKGSLDQCKILAQEDGFIIVIPTGFIFSSDLVLSAVECQGSD